MHLWRHSSWWRHHPRHHRRPHVRRQRTCRINFSPDFWGNTKHITNMLLFIKRHILCGHQKLVEKKTNLSRNTEFQGRKLQIISIFFKWFSYVLLKKKRSDEKKIGAAPPGITAICEASAMTAAAAAAGSWNWRCAVGKEEDSKDEKRSKIFGWTSYIYESVPVTIENGTEHVRAS